MIDSDERREFVRVEDSLVVQFNVLGSDAKTYANSGVGHADGHDVLGTWNRVRKNVVGESPNEGDALTSQLLLRVDWLLGELLGSLAKVGPPQVQVPKPTAVNIGGTGVRFESLVGAVAGDQLELMIILPVFIPIRCTAKVIRVRSKIVNDQVVHQIASSFTSMKDDDREQIVQYTFRRQSEILRQRNETQLAMT